MVCSAFCRGLMALSATAMSSASTVEMGTVHTHSSTVFFRQFKNRRYSMTLVKFPRPNANVSPPAAFRPL